MYLSDEDILFALAHHQLDITPFTRDHVQPVSVDLTLGTTFITPWSGSLYETDDPSTWQDQCDIVTDMTQWRLEPGAFVLGTTREVISFRSYVRGEHSERYDLWGQVHGKSTLGRLGLLVHITAGVIDPGFCGTITLELKNVGHNPIILHAETPICQLTVAKCGIVQNPYPRRASKYGKQFDTTWAK